MNKLRKLSKSTFATVLVLFFLTTLVITPTVVGAPTQPSYAYIFTEPAGIVQVGTTIIVGVFTSPAPASARNFNYTFTITQPDGVIESRLIPESQIDGTASFFYAPIKLGNYSVTMSWPGDAVRLPVTSPPTTFVVQKDPLVYPTYPGLPLDNYHWTFPINSIYREWYQISGAWPGQRFDGSGSNFNPYTKAPNTPHIIWTRTVEDQGLMGGETGYLSQMRGGKSLVSPYLTSWEVAAQGRLYWVQAHRDADTANQWNNDSYTGKYQSTVYANDLYSGEPLWQVDLPGFSTSNAQIFVEQADMKVQTTRRTVTGFRFSLWVIGGGIWELEPLTGRLETIISGPTSGTFAKVNGYGALFLPNWNATRNATQSGVMTRWDTEWNNITWVKSVPSQTFIDNDVLIQAQSDNALGVRVNTYNLTTGNSIMNGTYSGVFRPTGNQVVGGGNYYYFGADARVRAISLTTGQVVWTSEMHELPWGAFGTYTASFGYGNLYIASNDGNLRCYNGSTGKQLWSYKSGYTPENPYGTFPFWSEILIADGKVYAATGVHTDVNPPPIGHTFSAFDAMTGQVIWQYKDFSSRINSGIHAGMLWMTNYMDGQMYLFGKGDTKTTVSAPTITVPLGISVLLQGTVTDQSPGAVDTPAIADVDMSSWMQHIYNQSPAPMTAHGVPVILRALSSNGTMIDIATVTSNVMGQYEFAWTPPDQDTYQITAVFDGSNSYYASSAVTGLSVGSRQPDVPTADQVATQVVSQLPVPSPEPTLQVPTASEIATQVSATLPTVTTMDMTIAAILIVIVALLIVNIVLQRRRPRN